MESDSTIGLPNEANAFEEIAKSEQHVSISNVVRRYGKVITLVGGFDKSVDLKQLAKKLKEGLACGGTVKDGNIELQGEHKKRVKPLLVKLGFPESLISG